MVTRAAEQAGRLVDLLVAAGAEPVVVPLVEVVRDAREVDRLGRLDLTGFDWLVVTSPNGAAVVVDSAAGRTRRVAAVGAATAEVLTAAGIVVDLVPLDQRAAGLLAELPAAPGRVLVVQAVDADPGLVDGLRERGAAVTVSTPYRTVPCAGADEFRAAAVGADAVLFASGSAARAWVTAFGPTCPPVVVAMGPQTAVAARAAGLDVTVTAVHHSLEGLVEALVAHWS